MITYDNVITGEMNCVLPSPLGATFNPTMEQYNQAGYRERISIDQPAEGFRAKGYAVQEIDAATCKLVITEQINIADELEAARQARLATITPTLKMEAGMLREILRKHFGPNAETNHAVTYDVVQNYFIAKQADGSITTQELADMLVMQKLFSDIIMWTGDGTIWSFPFDILDT